MRSCQTQITGTSVGGVSDADSLGRVAQVLLELGLAIPWTGVKPPASDPSARSCRLFQIEDHGCKLSAARPLVAGRSYYPAGRTVISSTYSRFVSSAHQLRK